jgi:hypothetical protein
MADPMQVPPTMEEPADANHPLPGKPPDTDQNVARGKKEARRDHVGSSGLSGLEEDLEDIFDGLDLHGEEESDLDFSSELDELIGDVRWLAIFRVHTTKPFSHVAMFKQMRNTWAVARMLRSIQKDQIYF